MNRRTLLHGLAATAMEQGRIATLHAFGEPVQTLPELVPTGVYAVPEIGMVYKIDATLMRKFIRMTQVGDRTCDE